MDNVTIPQFYTSLSNKCQGLDPLLMAWEDVELSKLSELEVFLDEELVNFQNLVLKDKEAGYPASAFVSNVRKTFNTFLSWVGGLPADYLNPTGTDAVKEISLRNICLSLSCLWIPWLDSDYEPIVKEAKLVPNVMPIGNAAERAKSNREERITKELRDKLFSVIIGSSPEHKQRIYDAMKKLVARKGGKSLALYIQAAIDMGLLTWIPPFESMKKFWGVTKSQQSVSKLISKNGSLLDDRDVASRRQEIEYLLNTTT